MQENCSCGNSVKKSCCKTCICNCQKTIRNKKNSKIWPTAERYDFNYLEHKDRVKNMTAFVDTSPPKLYLNNILKKDTAIEDLKRTKEIMRENKTLLTRMNIISRTKGVIDTRNSLAGRRRSHLPKWHNWIDRIELENALLFKRILKTKPVITNKELAKAWQINLRNMRNRSIFPITEPWLQGVDVDEDPAAHDCIDDLRPKVFLDLAVKNGRTLGRVKILLYSDFAPMTCTKFLQLFPNYENNSKDVLKSSLIGCPINRVYQKLYAQFGKVDNEEKDQFPVENYTLAAHFIGTVAMLPNDQDMIDNTFLITFKPLSILNGKCSVFGRIVKGLNVLYALEGLGRQNGEPRENLIISNCGIIRPYKEFENTCNCLDEMKLAQFYEIDQN